VLLLLLLLGTIALQTTLPVLKVSASVHFATQLKKEWNLIVIFPLPEMIDADNPSLVKRTGPGRKPAPPSLGVGQQ
jgi:hypothetical protein